MWLPRGDLHNFGDGREPAQFLPRRRRPRVLRSSHHSIRRVGVQTPAQHRRYASCPHAPTPAGGYTKPSVVIPNSITCERHEAE